MMTTHAQARAKADTGMALAVDKADRDEPGWSDDAYHALEMYCLAHPGKSFLTEEVRSWGEGMGFVSAPDNAKAWGAVMQSAARHDLIVRVGYAPSKSSNLAPKCLWSAK